MGLPVAVNGWGRSKGSEATVREEGRRGLLCKQRKWSRAPTGAFDGRRQEIGQPSGGRAKGGERGWAWEAVASVVVWALLQPRRGDGPDEFIALSFWT